MTAESKVIKLKMLKKKQKKLVISVCTKTSKEVENQVLHL